jgi:hypothetical protein
MEPVGSLPSSQEPSTGPPILSQINPIHTIPSYLSKIQVRGTHDNILLSQIQYLPNLEG